MLVNEKSLPKTKRLNSSDSSSLNFEESTASESATASSGSAWSLDLSRASTSKSSRKAAAKALHITWDPSLMVG
jgi:hypothetical protein